MFYSSQHISLALPWSGLFLGILCFFGVILKGLVFIHSLSDISLVFKKYIYIFIYLAVLGFSCGTLDLHCGTQDLSLRRMLFIVVHRL